MKVKVEAPLLNPSPVSIEFVASILRNVGAVEEAKLEAIRRKAYDEGRESGTKYLKEDNQRLHKAISEFQEASGIRLDGYGGNKDLGSAVHTLSELKWRVGSINGAIKACEEIRGMLLQVETLAALEKVVRDEAHTD